MEFRGAFCDNQHEVNQEENEVFLLRTLLCISKSDGEMLSHPENKALPSPLMFDLTQLLLGHWPLTWHFAAPTVTLFLFIHLVFGPGDWIIWLYCTVSTKQPFNPHMFHCVNSLQHNTGPCYTAYIVAHNFTPQLLPHRHMHICIWWCFQAEFKVGSLQITRKVTAFYYTMTTGILTEDSELQSCLPERRGAFLHWDIIFSWPLDILHWDRTLISTNHHSAHIISAEDVPSTGTPASHRSILCSFPCGTSVASNCTQEYGWMRGFNGAVLVGALCQTSTFRWHQLVHFNYPLIPSALNKAHAKPGSNGLS